MSKANVTLQDYPIVLEWLKVTYQHQIPFFEVNADTLEVLNKLLTQTKQRNEMTKVLILDAQEKVILIFIYSYAKDSRIQKRSQQTC
jgi:helix-turn-helix protein